MQSILTILLALSFCISTSHATPIEEIDKSERCKVCGMFVAKYPNWVTQIHYTDGSVSMFDGVKDMMAYYFHPEKFGGNKDLAVKEIWVKDYYQLRWTDGKRANYVTGSDVLGPMGHEFIPFRSKASAKYFKKDHKGLRILKFKDITPRLVKKKRSGHKMRK